MSDMEKRTIGVGLIGFGNWARRGHIPLLKQLPGYSLAAIHAGRPGAAESAADEHGFRHAASSAEALAGHPEVDLVVVATTAPQHAEGIRAAIAAGKDVYCEWPLTPSITLSEELAAAAEAKGIRTVIGVQRRFAPFNRRIGELLRDGYVGRLRSVRMHVSMNYFQPVLPRALAWTVPPENFSSMVAIYVGHFLDMLLTNVGWPESLQALALNQFPEITIRETGERIATTNADEFALIGTLPGNALLTVHFEGGKRNGSGVQIDIVGEEGDLSINNSSAFGDRGEDYVILGARGDRQPLVPIPVPESYDILRGIDLPTSVKELAENYATFARDRATGSRTAPDFRDAIRLHRLIDAALRASGRGAVPGPSIRD